MVVMKEVLTYIDNIYDMGEEVTRKDLLRKHKSLTHDCSSEAAEMLVIFEAVASMIGYGFIIGSLRETYYG